MPITLDFSPVLFGPAAFMTVLSNRQAGAHPNVTTSFSLHQSEPNLPADSLKDASVELPPGLVGNPTATPQCDADRVAKFACPPDAAVGVATTEINFSPGTSNAALQQVSLIYNIRPYVGEPAAFAFETIAFPVRLDTSVRRGTDGQYRVYVSAPSLAEADPVVSSSVTLWGVPAEHNGPGPYSTTISRVGFQSFGGQGDGAPAAFLTSSQVCEGNPLTAGLPSLATFLAADSWRNQGTVEALGTPDLRDPNWRTERSAMPSPMGCDKLLFQPSLAAEPEVTQAGAPSGYTVRIHVPQNEDPNGLATPDLKRAVVTLPAGTVISPSAADGLRACSEEQFALRSPAPAMCADASEIGSVKIATPLVASPLEGTVFLGQPDCSPCTPSDAQAGRMIRLLLQAEGSGVRIKVEGSVSVDQSTGQLTTTFDEDPQLPFEDLTLTLHGGSRAPLANPSTCGLPLRVTSQLTPYSSETPAEPSSEPFQVTGCPSPQFYPSFTAGTINNQASAFSPETVTFSRTDQDQDLEGITVHTPPGLLGMLSKVQLCPQAQAQLGLCPPQSQIGTTTVGAGPGTNPFFLGGSVYLTDGYKGAPFGLSIVVPALAGPFNLGNVIVRAAINVDRSTSALTITSDALPQTLDGIPLQIRTVNVTINREGFIFNPTNCQPMAIEGLLKSTRGATAAVSSRYQAANCATLPFKPTFTVLTQAKTSKANGAYLHVKVTSGPGQANIAKVKVELPKQLPSRLTTLQKACLAAVFDANPATCPAASVVGVATAVTPVLRSSLTGPAYLVSHGGAKFPDLEIVLQGEGITLILDGQTDIKKGVTISSFRSVPDAPVTSFDLVLPQGPHSVLASNANLCSRVVTTTRRVRVRVGGRVVYRARKLHRQVGVALVMPTVITGQNGAVVKQTTRIAVSGCPKHKSANSRKKSKGKSR